MGSYLTTQEKNHLINNRSGVEIIYDEHNNSYSNPDRRGICIFIEDSHPRQLIEEIKKDPLGYLKNYGVIGNKVIVGIVAHGPESEPSRTFIRDVAKYMQLDLPKGISDDELQRRIQDHITYSPPPHDGFIKANKDYITRIWSEDH